LAPSYRVCGYFTAVGETHMRIMGQPRQSDYGTCVIRRDAPFGRFLDLSRQKSALRPKCYAAFLTHRIISRGRSN
jgi:hypothetical protein